MKKTMIIKNCPAKTGENGCVSAKTNNVECSKNKDCIIKQLIKEFPDIKKLLEVEYDN